MTTNIELEAAATLSTAADEIERRGYIQGWFAEPKVASPYDFQEACTSIGPDQLDMLAETYVCETDIEGDHWEETPLISDSIEREAAMKDCRVCAGGALNYLLMGDVTDASWEQTSPLNQPMAGAIWDSINSRPEWRDSMLSSWSFKLGKSHPSINTTGLVASFNDIHSQDDVVSMLRSAAALLLV